MLEILISRHVGTLQLPRSVRLALDSLTALLRGARYLPVAIASCNGFPGLYLTLSLTGID